jgi:hypothetical protein
MKLRTSLLLTALLFSGCSATTSTASNSNGPSGTFSEAAGGGGDSSAGSKSPSGLGGAPAGPPAEGTTAAPDGTTKPGVPAQPGLLTAGVWDDNRNFDVFNKYRSSQADRPGVMAFADEEYRGARARMVQSQAAHARLDVALVVDTTGSMGDEIRYLQTEFDALTTAIAGKYPNAEQRWSLVLYKDVGDKYVVKPSAFEANISVFRAALAGASAGGGGDTPEASDEALAAAVQLGWRVEPSVSKLLFWLSDAPHHVGKEARVATAIRALAASDVHVYPVASSGIDELTELTMRQSAQLTGGRYMFLTDDSGVGNSHKEPTIPCFFVTKLSDAVLRMVDIEMSGSYHEPLASEVLRKGGDPKDGRCMLPTGTFESY